MDFGEVKERGSNFELSAELAGGLKVITKPLTVDIVGKEQPNQLGYHNQDGNITGEYGKYTAGDNTVYSQDAIFAYSLYIGR